MSFFGRFSRTAAVIAPARTLTLVRSAGPAVDLAKVREAGHIDLAKRADEAGTALSRRGLSGVRAQGVMVLDHSGSMRRDYASGAVQTLVERGLGFVLQIDADGVVPVIPFDYLVHPIVNVGVEAAPGVEPYTGVVNRALWRPDQMGSTDLAAALYEVLRMAKTTTAPLYVAVVTDGDPDDKRAATEVVCELARYPVFLKFLAIKHVPYLIELDRLDPSRRLLDNVNAQPEDRGMDLLTCTDQEFADAMAMEWDSWITAATAAGVLA